MALKRTGPIKRKTPLKAAQYLTKRIVKNNRARVKAAKKTGPDEDTVNVVVARADGSCERCRRGPVEQIHHRKPRGSGGSSDPAINNPSNLLAVCAPCHLEIEGDRTVSKKQGWLVRFEHNPAETPVWIAGLGKVFLNDDGTTTQQETAA
jgi:hypothetical protein